MPERRNEQNKNIHMLTDGESGNLVLKPGVDNIQGYAISSTTEGGEGPEGIRYVLAQWGKGKKSCAKGLSDIYSNWWLKVEETKPNLDNDPKDLPEDAHSGKGIIFADGSGHLYYVPKKESRKVIGLKR